ncbi:MAG TPA: RICIN domain-containing protein [Verrucomicrobiae bacterium]|jgi:hypothetical protein|nr:RICIN domain-containing protein [Verrucomicrobiae bacterium]
MFHALALLGCVTGASALTIDDDYVNSHIGVGANPNDGVTVNGGTYYSPDVGTPAITIATTKPVTIQNCTVQGPGDLISSTITGSQVFIYNVTGIGTAPPAGRVTGRFIYLWQAKSAQIFNTYTSHTRGIKVEDADDNVARTTTFVDIGYNVGNNIDGRYGDGNGGYLTDGSGDTQAHFIQISRVRPGDSGIVWVYWNECVNDISFNNSLVSDVINLWRCQTGPDNRMDVHDNYAEGSNEASGSGIIADGDRPDTDANTIAFMNCHDNIAIKIRNAGFSIAAGHDNAFWGNNAVTFGHETPYDWNSPFYTSVSQAQGGAVWDSYQQDSLGNGAFHNNWMHDSIGCVNRHNVDQFGNQWDSTETFWGDTNQMTQPLIGLGHPPTTDDENDQRNYWISKKGSQLFGANLQPIPDGTHTVRAMAQPGLRLTVQGGGSGNQTAVDLENSGQQLVFTYQGGGWYRIGPSYNPSKTLEINWNGLPVSGNGDAVWIWDWWGGPNQLWQVTPVPGGYTLTPQGANGLSSVWGRLDVAGGGTGVQLWTCFHNVNQTWFIDP